MNSQNWKKFDLISKFVSELTEIFGKKQHSLSLYNCLLGKTKITHHDAITKHIQAFSNFITTNKQAIMEKNSNKFIDPIIFYSKKVNIKMDEIFKMSDSETTSIIWQHLLVITNSIDPSDEAMIILKKTLEEKTNESDFLNDLVQKIEKNVDPNNSTDPMAAIMGLMNSGVFTELLQGMNSGMQNGNLDIGKLFGTVQGMMSSIGGNMGNGLNLNSLNRIEEEPSSSSSSSQNKDVSKED